MKRNRYTDEEIAAAAAVVNAPVGSVVLSLPRFYDTLWAANARYHFAEGSIYQATDSGYQGVAPPIGIEVKELPPAAEMVKVGGQQYFVYNDIYYQALYSGSGIELGDRHRIPRSARLLAKPGSKQGHLLARSMPHVE